MVHEKRATEVCHHSDKRKQDSQNDKPCSPICRIFWFINTALDTVHNVAETGTGAVQGVVDGVLPAVGGAVQSVGGVVQGVAGIVPELPIGGAQQPSK
ncbi:hypothetical protein B9Z55_015620 [Caenorhabditis nigoni]|uniref:Uncharacterized protein n=1 Tax=Caenorhabditis nigoni TaxID=1611254 RepID=A0A2G5UB56_9PELO|nr:hypothetical protein B9Z55_015620 [Caenorhabditis nigoni]